MAEKRFVKIYSQDLGNTKILLDTQTGIQYLFVQSGYAGGLTPLLTREGNPAVGTQTTVENWDK